jgi:hypothetical protein
MKSVAAVRSALVSLAVTGVLVHARDARAEDDEIEDVVQEVFLGSVAFSQDARELQLSLASSWIAADEADVFAPLLAGEWGLTDRLQLEVETPFAIAVPDQGEADGGLGNAEVGVLYNVVRSPALGLVASAGASAVLPTASTAMVDRAWGGGALVSLYKYLGPVHATLSVETGALVPVGDEAELGVEGALGVIVPLGRVIPIVEVGFEREDDSELRCAAGFAWAVADGIELGLAGLVSRGDDDTEWGALVGLTWERTLGGQSAPAAKREPAAVTASRRSP